MRFANRSLGGLMAAGSVCLSLLLLSSVSMKIDVFRWVPSRL